VRAGVITGNPCEPEHRIRRLRCDWFWSRPR
jgi:hypothetical protein